MWLLDSESPDPIFYNVHLQVLSLKRLFIYLLKMCIFGSSRAQSSFSSSSLFRHSFVCSEDTMITEEELDSICEGLHYPTFTDPGHGQLRVKIGTGTFLHSSVVQCM